MKNTSGRRPEGTRKCWRRNQCVDYLLRMMSDAHHRGFVQLTVVPGEPGIWLYPGPAVHAVIERLEALGRTQ